MMIDPRSGRSSSSPPHSNRESADEFLSSEEMEDTDELDSEISMDTEIDLGSSDQENKRSSGMVKSSQSVSLNGESDRGQQDSPLLQAANNINVRLIIYFLNKVA